MRNVILLLALLYTTQTLNAQLPAITQIVNKSSIKYKDTIECDGPKATLWDNMPGIPEMKFHVFYCMEDLAEVLDYSVQTGRLMNRVNREQTRTIFQDYVRILGNLFYTSEFSPGDLIGFGQDRYLTFKEGFAFEHNTFDGGILLSKLRFRTSDSLSVRTGLWSNEVSNLVLDDVQGDDLAIVSNKFPWLSFEDTEEDFQTFAIRDGRLNTLVFNENKAMNLFTPIYFESCSFANEVAIEKNEFLQDASLYFLRDTIKGSFSFSNNKGAVHKIVFRDCFINADFRIQKASLDQNISVSFINCSFGANTSMENLALDTVSFQRCANIPYAFPLSFANGGQTIIRMAYSRVENILFDYSENVKLLPNPELNYEARISAYETILEKFRKEGRLLSLQNLDIEYKQLKYSQQGTWGNIRSFIDKVWWNYGYSKFYILWWTLAFLVFFYLINYIGWNKMHAAYGVMGNKAEAKVSQNRFRRRPATYNDPKTPLLVLLFTSFIFFKLRIDFDKLNYKNKGAIVIFFVQYLTGLICMFFIFNAIIKI